MFCLTTLYYCRLPRSLKTSPLQMGDEILEINGVPIVDQDQKEVCLHVLWRECEAISPRELVIRCYMYM